MPDISVREHARLTTRDGYAGLDFHTISGSAFTYLCALSGDLGKSKLVQLESPTSLRVLNHVGVVETPCGTTLEILPKHTEAGGDLEACRSLLVKMLGVVLSVKPEEAQVAHIRLLRHPLTEWVMAKFLARLDHLVKRGVRFQYRELEEESRFLRGRLDVARQVRQPPGSQHLLHVRHEIFDADRAENRLLRSAVSRVRKAARDPANWRLANELGVLLEEIPQSSDVAADFAAWRGDRLMAHYAPVRPWCELVLGQAMPMTQQGHREGISLLFPMEKLFEQYVACALRRQLRSGMRLVPQPAFMSLCAHDGDWKFRLKPDILIEGAEGSWVLDTKWKMLDQDDGDLNYGMDPGDVYQLLAYGYRYLGQRGHVYLVYPASGTLTRQLPDFCFSPELRLTVLPFDLQADRLLGNETPFLGPPATRD